MFFLIPLAIAAAQVGGAVASAVAGAKAQKKQANAEAEQALKNAQYAEDAAARALQRGAREEGQIRTSATQLIARQRVAYATSGVDASSGSALATYAYTRGTSEQDVLTARNNAMKEAYGFRTQGLDYARQADLSREAGRQAAVGSYLGAAGQVLGAAGNFVGNVNAGRG